MRYQKATSLRGPLKRLRTRNVSPIPSGLEHGQAAPQKVKEGLQVCTHTEQQACLHCQPSIQSKPRRGHSAGMRKTLRSPNSIHPTFLWPNEALFYLLSFHTFALKWTLSSRAMVFAVTTTMASPTKKAEGGCSLEEDPPASEPSSGVGTCTVR